MREHIYQEEPAPTPGDPAPEGGDGGEEPTPTDDE